MTKDKLKTKTPLSALLKKLRKGAGLKQEELAKLLGVQRVTISAYETGRILPSAEKLHEIAGILKVDEKILFAMTAHYDMEESVSDKVSIPDDMGGKLLKCCEELPLKTQDAFYGLIKDLYKEGHLD